MRHSPTLRIAAAFAALLLCRAAVAAEAVRATLDNGLRVVVVPSALAPVVTTEVNYLVGSDEAPPGFPGMAHAQEHMMFRGSPGLSAAQLSTMAAALGGDFNADTQQTVTQYYLTVPADDLEIPLRIEAARMRAVLDTNRLWHEERGAIEQEVAQDLSDPEYLLYTRLLGHLFAGTPYAVDALGTRGSFQKTTGAMLRRFHETWYAPNNAVLVIAGDVDPASTLARVRELFGAIPSKPLPSRRPVTLAPLAPASFDLESDLPYGLAVVAYRLPGYRSPDWAAGRVLARVLASQRADVYGLVPQGKALEAGFEDDSLPEAGLGFAFATFPRGGSGTALVAELKKVIAGYVQGGVPPELVAAAQRLALTGAALRQASISGLADDWSQAVAVEGRQSPAESEAAIARVTAADVDRVARAYLVDGTAVTAIMTPRASGAPVAKRPSRGGESFAPKHVRPVALPSWAAGVASGLKVPASRLAPVDAVLPNGLRLIVQPEPQVAAVAVYGQVKNDPDVQTPPGQEGVSDLLDELFSYGTTRLDRLAYQKALDDIGATADVGTSFSLAVLPDAFDRGMELLAAGLLQPALPEAAFQVVRRQTVAELPGMLESPSFLVERARDRALFPKGDPRQREPSVASVSRLTLEDVRAYHRLAVRPDLTTIVVIGRVTPEQAREVVGRYFGAWRAVGPRPPTDPPPVPPNAASSVVVPDVSRVQDQVTLVQTLGITRQEPAYYTLELGNHVLAGGLYASRLTRDLREESGLVYYVGAEVEAGRTRSSYSVEYACDPAKVGKARELVLRDLVQMQKEPVSATELQWTRALLVHRIPLQESSFGLIARGLLARSLDALPLDEPQRAAERYLATTPAEVQAAFARWIRPRDFVQITLGPAPR
jgi:zinc protease